VLRHEAFDYLLSQRVMGCHKKTSTIGRDQHPAMKCGSGPGYKHPEAKSLLSEGLLPY
jgi:hypothetical protein